MTDTIKISRELMERVHSLLVSVCLSKPYPASAFSLRNELGQLLATPPSDAADMGGQAGEEVEILGYWTEDGLHWTEESAAHGSKGYQSLMTVSQHLRILAQHRQQAGKLVEALRAADEYLSDNPFNEIGSRSILHRQMKDALSTWRQAQEGKP